MNDEKRRHDIAVFRFGLIAPAANRRAIVNCCVRRHERAGPGRVAGLHQATASSLIPSLNLTPLTTSAMSL